MQGNTPEYARFLRLRALANRAIGRHIILQIERGNVATLDPTNILGLVSADYHVKGLDTDVTGPIMMSGFRHERRRAAIQALRVAGFLPPMGEG